MLQHQPPCQEPCTRTNVSDERRRRECVFVAIGPSDSGAKLRSRLSSGPKTSRPRIEIADGNAARDGGGNSGSFGEPPCLDADEDVRTVNLSSYAAAQFPVSVGGLPVEFYEGLGPAQRALRFTRTQ